jgi:hypothetical protein
MNSRLMLWAAIAVSLAGVQLQADQRPNPPAQTPEQISLAGQGPPRLTIPNWIEPPAPKRFGVFTVMAPDQPGEFVRVSVPVGALVMRAVHAIGDAQHRRAEEKARKEVAQELKDFLTSQR